MSAKDQIQGELDHFMHGLERRNPGETEFHQAVREVAETLMPFIMDHAKYKENYILERMTEPDRIIIFRVSWEDDNGRIHANRAWLFIELLDPYFHRGGTRMDKAPRGDLVRQGLDQVDVALSEDVLDDVYDHIVVEHPRDLILDRLFGRRHLDIHREARALGDALLMGIDTDLGIEHEVVHEDAVVRRIDAGAAARHTAGSRHSLFRHRHEELRRDCSRSA